LQEHAKSEPVLSGEDIRAAAIHAAHQGPQRRPSSGSVHGLHDEPSGIFGVVGSASSSLDLKPSDLPVDGGSNVRHKAEVHAQVHGLRKRTTEELLQHAQAEADKAAADKAAELRLHEEIEAARPRRLSSGR